MGRGDHDRARHLGGHETTDLAEFGGAVVRGLARPGRILIDATNQWADPPPAAVLDVLDVGGSELVASLRPEAHVIKAFDNLYGPVIATDPATPMGRRILFYAGDEADAKRRFRTVVEDFGYAPVDLVSR